MFFFGGGGVKIKKNHVWSSVLFSYVELKCNTFRSVFGVFNQVDDRPLFVDKIEKIYIFILDFNSMRTIPSDLG